MHTEQKTLLFLSNTAFSMWNFRRTVMEHYVQRGFRVVCVADPDNTVAYIQSLGVEFVPLKISRSGAHVIEEFELLRRLYKIFRNYSPNLIFAYTIKPNIYAPLLARVAGIKCVCVVTGLGSAFTQKNLKAFLGRTLLYVGLYASHKFLVINRDDKHRLCRHHFGLRRKFEILPGEGINTDYFYPQKSTEEGPCESIKFLMIARLLKDKGVYEFCRAFKIVKSQFEGVRACILGAFDPSSPSALTQAEFKLLCQECDVEHLGFAGDVRPLIAASDICVLPSYREGIPFALLEAGSMERVLITTNAPGCRDVVREGENGFLVEPRSVSDLADAMIRTITLSLYERQQMGRRAREICVEQFSILQILDQYDSVVERLIAVDNKSTI